MKRREVLTEEQQIEADRIAARDAANALARDVGFLLPALDKFLAAPKDATARTAVAYSARDVRKALKLFLMTP